MRRLRKADLIPICAGLALLLWAAATRRSLPWTPSSARVWGVLAGMWSLSVAYPLWGIPWLSARLPAMTRFLSHLGFAAFCLLLLFEPPITALEPMIIGVVALLIGVTYLFGHARPGFEPDEILFRFSPLLITAFGYVGLRWLLPAPTGPSWDAELAALDARLFGGSWSLLVEPFQSPWLTEWFALNYVSYLAYPVIASLLLYAAGAKREFEELALSFALAMHLGYLFYLLVPAQGPAYGLAAEYSHHLSGGRALGAMGALVGVYSYDYDVFPSLHVANSLICVAAIRLRFPRLFPFAAFGAFNILLSTIWLRMHYTIDIAAGILLATAVWYATPRLIGNAAPLIRTVGVGRNRHQPAAT